MTANISFSVTPYLGYEDEVLKVFNQTRGQHRKRRHFDWRYLGEKKLNESALIFWVISGDGHRVGMAGLVPRPYWINGNLETVWVLGDISLDGSFRGQGIGRRFFLFISSYMKKACLSPGLVIPNEPAKKGLLSAGWSTPHEFVWYVSIVKPAQKLLPYYSPKWLKNLLNLPYEKIVLWKLTRYKDGSVILVETNGFDQSFDNLWREFPKKGLIIRDRAMRSLQWRFADHPSRLYKIYKLLGERLLGYIVCELPQEGTCRVADLLCLNENHLKTMMVLFFEKMYAQKEITTIRIKLSDNHIWDGPLRKLGFFKKLEGDVFQEYESLGEQFCNYKWLLSIADKDV